MEPITSEEIVAYGRELQRAYPDISSQKMKKALLVNFAGGKDVLRVASTGIIFTPLSVYLALLKIVYNSIRKRIETDKAEIGEIQQKIDEAVEELIAVR
jgi:hypothetical protein